MRRRARFLRKARELAYRDLGGLVFNLHRFGQRNDALVIAKLSTLGQIDTELRSLETALQEHQPVTVLHEAGITACPRCAAIHSGEDRFCPNCGLPMSRHVDLPIASAPGPAAGAASTASLGRDPDRGRCLRSLDLRAGAPTHPGPRRRSHAPAADGRTGCHGRSISDRPTGSRTRRRTHTRHRSTRSPRRPPAPAAPPPSTTVPARSSRAAAIHQRPARTRGPTGTRAAAIRR